MNDTDHAQFFVHGPCYYIYRRRKSKLTGRNFGLISLAHNLLTNSVFEYAKIITEGRRTEDTRFPQPIKTLFNAQNFARTGVYNSR